MDLMEIPDVERVKGAAFGRGYAEVFFIFPADHAGFSGGGHINSTGPKTANQVTVHCVLVNVQTKAAHIRVAGAGKISSAAASSAAMSLSISSRLAW